MNSNLGNMAHGRFDFTGAQTGVLGMTDLFLGRSSVFQQNAFTGTQNRLDYIGLYAQDSWKATPRLTVNYGMRWDPYLPVAKKHDYMAHLDFNWMMQGVKSKVWPAPRRAFFIRATRCRMGKFCREPLPMPIG